VSRPAVAVVAYHLRPGRVSFWTVGGYGVPENYVDAVRRAGGYAVLVLPGEERSPAEILERADALLLVGGGDVEPSRYGARPDSTVYGLEPDRDELEIGLLREGDRRELPTLCVCRGMQVMNVAFGGSLIQHLPDDGRFAPHGTPSGEDRLVHEVELDPGSRIATATQETRLSCASHHHQGVAEDGIGEGLVVTGRSPDGLVEALERTRGWMLGAQWHPEESAAEDPAQQRLFDALVERARDGAPSITQRRGA
jgi:putative glutamine amidotransferase